MRPGGRRICIVATSRAPSAWPPYPQLESALGRRLLVTTDHEGGRIIMLGAGVTIFPDHLAAGTAGEVAFAKRQGLIEGRELRRLGVDVSFGPVLDVLTERYSPNIGIRSTARPRLVGRVGAPDRGAAGSGVPPPKHFPGKGLAGRRPLGLPVIDSDWASHSVHLVPFMAAMEAGVDCLMTSHPLYPNLDRPARSRHVLAAYRHDTCGSRWLSRVVAPTTRDGAMPTSARRERRWRAASAGHYLPLVCTRAASARHQASSPPTEPRPGRRSLERSVSPRRPAPARAGRFDGGPARLRLMASPSPSHRARRGHRRDAAARRLPLSLKEVVAVFPRLPARRRITVELHAGRARFLAEAMAPMASLPSARVGVEPGGRIASGHPGGPPTPASCSSTTPTYTRRTERCSTPSRAWSVRWPSCSCATPTTPASSCPISAVSLPLVGAAASSRLPSPACLPDEPAGCRPLL